MRAVLLLLVSGFAAGGAASITSCGGAGDHLSNVVVSLSPDPIERGQPFTVELTGDLDEDLSALVVDLDLDVKVAVISKHVSATVNVQTPVPKGPVKVVVGPFSLVAAPGSAAVDGTVRLANGKGEAVACLKLDLDVPLLASPLGDYVKSCGGPGDHAKDLSVAYDDDVLTITGTMDEALTDATLHVDVVLEEWFVKVPISLSTKIQYLPGVLPGPFKIVANTNTAENGAASRLGLEARGTVRLDDGKGAEVACVKFDEPVPAARRPSGGASSVAGAGLRSGAVALDWTACGNPAHGTVTSLEPSTLELGQETTLVVKGKLGENVQGGKYTVKAKAGWVSVFTHTGDVCTPEVIELPFGLGHIKWDGVTCPVSEGPLTVSLQVALSGSIPSWLARGTIDFEATSTSGEEVACLKITTAPASSAPLQVV